jgi:4-hydroxy-4-methyl-2-oxoglutarate aldolase
MRTPHSLDELRPLLRAALVCDALDSVGIHDAALSSRFNPLDKGTVMIGRAFTVATVVVHEAPEVPYVGLLRALDALSPDDIYVISACGREDVSLWGELLTNASLAAGAAGALCEGTVRDTAQVRSLGFPCFSYGTAPYDINGRLEVTAFAVPTMIEARAVQPGQLIVADADGVVIVPEIVEADAVEGALAKARAEAEFRTAVAAGVKPSEAFTRYGVL